MELSPSREQDKEYEKARARISRKIAYMWRFSSVRSGPNDVKEDALAIGMISFYEGKSIGLEGDALYKYATTRAISFIAKEARETRRNNMSITASMFGDGDKTYVGSIDRTVQVKPRQEIDTDAHMIANLIGDAKLTEMICYGTRSEGGISRVRAEMKLSAIISKLKG